LSAKNLTERWWSYLGNLLSVGFVHGCQGAYSPAHNHSEQ
jgi:hypothetical protein